MKTSDKIQNHDALNYLAHHGFQSHCIDIIRADNGESLKISDLAKSKVLTALEDAIIYDIEQSS